MSAKEDMNHLCKLARSRKDLNSLAEVGVGQLAIDLVLSSVDKTPAEEYSKPKCVTELLPNMHFDPRNVKPAAFSLPRINCKSLTYDPISLEYTIQSSM